MVNNLTLTGSPLNNRGYSLLHPRFVTAMDQHPEGVPRESMEVRNH